MLVCMAWASSQSFDALTRLAARSYFWICWKVRPTESASFSWLMPSSLRRMRMRRPTWRSTGFGPVSMLTIWFMRPYLKAALVRRPGAPLSIDHWFSNAIRERDEAGNQQHHQERQVAEPGEEGGLQR